ncbi:hypothetical protein FGO68_gene14027 [Halteria grandinella]|uniref:TRP C-terminal domain-containing protein n=1 Tax=Halteria grandinella TaxID=5974 RepID=A0A8J8TA12_HALGN|nr:hypothetical protein FGO68_gene14027 [Halteria grandinella]
MEIPSQINDLQKGLSDAFANGMNGLAYAAIPGGLVLNFFASMIMQLIWNLLNDLSFLTILSLVSMNVPGVVQIIQSTMLSFIYLDLLKTDKWVIPIIFGSDDDPEDDHGLNSYLEENGFGSMSLIKNLQSTFIYLVGIVIIIIFIGILKLFGLITKLFQRPESYLQKKMFWNGAMRFFIQQFSPMLFSALINLYNMHQNERSGFVLGTVLSPIIVVLLVVGTGLIVKLLHQNQQNYRQPSFIAKYGTIIESLNHTSKVGAYWNVLIIIRWTLSGLIFICLREYPGIQVPLLLLLSVKAQFFIILGKPFDEKSENIMNFINELVVSVYVYVLFSLTDFTQYSITPIREEIGWLLVLIVLSTVFMNLVKLQIMIYLKLKSKWFRYRPKFTTEKGKYHKADNICSIGETQVFQINPQQPQQLHQQQKTSKVSILRVTQQSHEQQIQANGSNPHELISVKAKPQTLYNDNLQIPQAPIKKKIRRLVIQQSKNEASGLWEQYKK